MVRTVDGIGRRIVTDARWFFARCARVVGCRLVAAAPRLAECNDNASARIEPTTDTGRCLRRLAECNGNAREARFKPTTDNARSAT
jgi:hypothetical protein